MSTNDVTIANLVLKIGERDILNDISCSFSPYTVTMFCGGKKSGKTCLLQSMNQMIEMVPNVALFGKVIVGEQNLFYMDALDIRQKVSYISKETLLFPYLSIAKNVLVPYRLTQSKLRRKEAVAKLKSLLSLVELWEPLKDRLDDGIETLNKEDCFRLYCARAMALSPKLLVIDDLLKHSHMDRDALKAMLLELKKHVTVVATTSDLEDARDIADYVGVLEKGTLVSFDRTEPIKK